MPPLGDVVGETGDVHPVSGLETSRATFILAVQLAQLRPERATQSLGIAISIDSRL
jgi:hypothetical protein